MERQQRTGSGSRLEMITFLIGKQELCVDVMTVREIRVWTPATPKRSFDLSLRTESHLQAGVCHQRLTRASLCPRLTGNDPRPGSTCDDQRSRFRQ